ncbi:hypothetical protein [Aquimarina sp. RZ0]|uniref:hypothetical protein n=1 Tax=Aquimarina sp. RZ0 TaxID=2607730 RepID=UPI0011F3BC2C|nr:hypothetical protein [Aquimarina sp. RZ0]KAA1247651.1 hypothetical protein F0000_02260 [Aquimarina sp. RZ0]
MNEKKNIDRLFQEKFKNFEVTPDDAVWERIKAHKEEDRKRILFIPLWYRIAGVAALVTIILSIGSVYMTDTINQDSVVSNEALDKIDAISPDNNNNNNTDNSNNTLVDIQENQDTENQEHSSETKSTNNEGISGKPLNTEEEKVSKFKTPTNAKTIISDVNKNTIPNKNTIRKESIVTNMVQNTNTADMQKKEDIFSKSGNNSEKAITGIVTNDTLVSEKMPDIYHKNNLQNSKNSIAENTALLKEKKPKTDIAKDNIDTQLIKKPSTTEGIAENIPTLDNKKQKITDKENPTFKDSIDKNQITKEAIAENIGTTDALNKKEDELDDTSAENPDALKKSIFDEIDEKEKDKIAIAEEKSIKRWDVIPTIAPVYYNPTGNESTVNNQFSDNAKTGQVNLSYGIQVAYNFNKKISVRSGVNKLDVSYNTEGIGFSASSFGRNLNGIDYNDTSMDIIISDFNTNQQQTPPGTAAPDVNGESLVGKQNLGLLNHSIGYIEVPIELTYALSDKKLGVHMVGGISTLFLENNELSINAGDFKTNLGEASNINEISFSGNFGIGLDYKLSEQFHINMEPILKYQFNGFKESAKDFRPYYFGVYTGVSFRF